MVSPSSQPTVLPFSHLYHLESCAQFVSDFIYYQPRRAFVSGEGLPDAAAPRLFSPTHTLATQIGNSLEMSHVLGTKNSKTQSGTYDDAHSY